MKLLDKRRTNHNNRERERRNSASFWSPKLVKFKSAEENWIGKEKESSPEGEKFSWLVLMISVSAPCSLKENDTRLFNNFILACFSVFLVQTILREKARINKWLRFPVLTVFIYPPPFLTMTVLSRKELLPFYDLASRGSKEREG